MSDHPRIDRAAWTFSLTADCVYCDKKCTRSMTFYAMSKGDAEAQADAALTGLCHRKCGGF